MLAVRPVKAQFIVRIWESAHMMSGVSTMSAVMAAAPPQTAANLRKQPRQGVSVRTRELRAGVSALSSRRRMLELPGRVSGNRRLCAAGKLNSRLGEHADSESGPSEPGIEAPASPSTSAVPPTPAPADGTSSPAPRTSANGAAKPLLGAWEPLRASAHRDGGIEPGA